MISNCTRIILLYICSCSCSINEECYNSIEGEYSYFYDYLTGTGAHNFSESLTIGFLGAYGQAQVVLGALPLAVEAVNNNKGEKWRF